jgi:SHS2 domain-containing protein
MKWSAPSPYRELDHTADLAIEVEGETEAEVYARAALALGQLLAGSDAIVPASDEVFVERALTFSEHDRVARLIALLRGVLALFYDERLILAAIDLQTDPACSAVGWFVPWNATRHREGSDVKAITYGGASFAKSQSGRKWMARLIFDI